MDNLLHIRLRATSLERRHDRGYQMRLGTDLFGYWRVLIAFGRYGTGGTLKARYFENRIEAFTFIEQQLKRRLTAHKRIGCSYQILSVEGRNDILALVNNKTIERFSRVNTFKEIKG